MTESKELLLASRAYASERRWLSWWHLLSTLAVFTALVVMIAASDKILVRLPASFLLGLVTVRLFILYHDFEHGTILQGSRVASLILRIHGLFVLNPPSIWRRSHDHHHRNNAKIYGASIGSYPVMTRSGYTQASRRERLLYGLSRHPVTIAMGYLTIFFYGMCLRSLLVNPRLHADSALSIALHIGLLVVLWFVSPALMLFLMIVPMFIATALGAYLFYAQHNFPGVKLSGRADWDYLFAALHSSSFIRMGPLMRWFTGNIGYHHVHHLNARIPFYRLPEAMAGMKELQSPGTTSLTVMDVYRCLRLKLWDPVEDRMVTFRAATQASSATS